MSGADQLREGLPVVLMSSSTIIAVMMPESAR